MAKKFSFRLESVRKLKEHKAKQEENALQQIVNSRYQKEYEIEEHQKYYNSLLTTKTGKFSASEFQQVFFHQNQVKSEIKKLAKEHEQLIEIEEIQRKKMNDAKIEEKAINKLKERKIIAHNETLEKEERMILDEIAQNRHSKSENIGQ